MSRMLLLLMMIPAISACSAMNTVKPWDKDVLARPEMALVDDKVMEYLDAHIYFSKEGSLGGQGMGGGGCGCN